MTATQWIELALFMGALGAVTLLVLAASGHFPAAHRDARLQGKAGAAVLWGSLGLGAVTLLVALVFASRHLPIAVAIIGGGLAVLAGPLLLQPLPDSVVDGRRGLAAFATIGAALALLLWTRLA